MRITLLFVLLAGVLVVVIQLLAAPRLNPPVVTRLRWDSVQTQRLVAGACLDCHSNETKWPWYSAAAPVSWFITPHVCEGRAALNFSTLNGADLCGIAAMVSEMRIRDGSMPLRSYQLAHPAAWLTSADRERLIQGLYKTLAQAPYRVTAAPTTMNQPVSGRAMTNNNALLACKIGLR